MIKVKLIDDKNGNPLELASHAALECYQAEVPEMGKKIDVENRLFNTGHHTTLQHSSCTFSVEGISVGDITFGMHLVSPFYNSDQRSGRYCAKMFLEPDFAEIEKYISEFWPLIEKSKRADIMDYIKCGVKLYHDNIAKASAVALKLIKDERPFADEKYIEQNAPKIAQEQLRMFIPIVFPTGFDITLNLTAIAALYESAWTPAMQYVTKQMAAEVVSKYPELTFMFKKERASIMDWGVPCDVTADVDIKYKPELKLLEVRGDEKFSVPKFDMMYPLDKLQFSPEMMDNSIGDIHTKIEISVATMGQDQRHRTIRRGMPRFTGNFYVPPIIAELKLEEKAKQLMRTWLILSKDIPKSLATVIAPYGAMVSYEKVGSFNALAHEQGKRLCWCAQEEIYHISRLLRMKLEKKLGSNSSLLNMLEPPCYHGKCVEGARYCGRDIKLQQNGDYFPERSV